MSSNGNATGQHALTSQQKYVKKLEKENYALKQGVGLLSVSKTSEIRVAENKDLGTHVILSFGVSGSGSAHTIVYHRPIGIDPTIPLGSWIASDARDIPGFLSTKVHPGAAKINSNITFLKEKFAVSEGLLQEGPNGLKYPECENTRSAYMDDARWYRGMYANAKGIPMGEVPSVEFFMPPEAAQAELKYRHGLRNCAEYMEEVDPFWIKLVTHRPHTMNMTIQRTAPFLYGVGDSMLAQSIYSHSAGMAVTTEKPPDEWSLITETILPVNTKFVDKEELQKLLVTLAAYGVAVKARNIADSNEKSGKSKSKEEKEILSKDKKQASDELSEAKLLVMASEPNFGPITKGTVYVTLTTADLKDSVHGNVKSETSKGKKA